jgi:RsiW-degrading membrane proteinase PrsW (M82 family)
MGLLILYFLISFIPVLLYILTIWLSSPINSIDLKKSIQYSLTGILSVGMLFIYFRMVPKCHHPISSDVNLSFWFLAFIQISLIEELSKFISFNINERMRGIDDVKYDSAIGTMFYCGISALGFSFIENIDYAIKFGGQILIIRSFFSMLLHFICGLIMGYWISLSRIPTRMKDRSLLELFFIKYKKLKKWVYSLIGIGCAVILHGMFDYNIFTGGHIVSNYIILLSGIIAVYLGVKDLQEKTKIK